MCKVIIIALVAIAFVFAVIYTSPKDSTGPR